MDRIARLPAWVVPTLDEVQECYRAVCRLAGSDWADERDRGVFAAFVWLTVGEVAPVTERPGIDMSREAARAENWVALCVAAGQPGPTDRDWERLDVEPRRAVSSDPEYAYGAWRALSWLLGVREDWPVYTSWHRAAELPRERPHMRVPVSERNTAAWRAADQAARDQARTDALRHWTHVRQLADRTDSAAAAEVAG